MNLEEIMERLRENESLLADGLEAGLIGICSATGRAVYDSEKCIQALMADAGGWEGAREYFEYNTLRSLAYFGDKAPIFIEIAEEVLDAADSTAR